MTTNIVYFLVTLSVAFSGVGCDEVTFGPKRRLPDDKLFQDPGAFCEGCYGFVHEIHKLLTKWDKEKGSLEDHIDAAMVAVCSTDRLRAYVLSPPKMERLCSGIRAHYEDEIGLALMKNYGKKTPDVEQTFKDICKKAIPACPKNMKPMSVGKQEQREREAAERAAKEENEEGKEKESEKLEGGEKEKKVKKSKSKGKSDKKKTKTEKKAKGKDEL